MKTGQTIRECKARAKLAQVLAVTIRDDRMVTVRVKQDDRTLIWRFAVDDEVWLVTPLQLRDRRRDVRLGEYVPNKNPMKRPNRPRGERLG